MRLCACLDQGTILSSRAYVVSYLGAVKLLRVWQKYPSIEACFNHLHQHCDQPPFFKALVPGEGAEVVHVDRLPEGMTRPAH